MGDGAKRGSAGTTGARSSWEQNWRSRGTRGGLMRKGDTQDDEVILSKAAPVQQLRKWQ